MRKGEVYQHYKNNNYTFLGITSPVIKDFINWESVITNTAIDEATNRKVDVYEVKDDMGTSIYFAELPVQHVLYESHVDGRLWLRNARDFFGPITGRSTLRFMSLGEPHEINT